MFSALSFCMLTLIRYSGLRRALNDIEKPMKIELMYDPAKTPLVDRVAPAATTTAPMEGVQRFVVLKYTYGMVLIQNRTGGRPRRGRGGRPRRNNRLAKSPEDLDAEMEVCLIIEYCMKGVNNLIVS